MRTLFINVPSVKDAVDVVGGVFVGMAVDVLGDGVVTLSDVAVAIVVVPVSDGVGVVVGSVKLNHIYNFNVKNNREQKIYKE